MNRDQIRSDIPGDLHTCAKGHVRIYFEAGPCPCCEEARAHRQTIDDDEAEAYQTRREAIRRGQL